MKLVLYLALLYICYFLAIGVDPVGAKRKKCYYVDKYNKIIRPVSHPKETEKTINHKPKKVDTKQYKHPKPDLKEKTSNNDSVALPIVDNKNESKIDIEGLHLDTKSNDHKTNQSNNKTEVKRPKLEPDNHTEQPKDNTNHKSDRISESTFDPKQDSKKTPKNLKSSDIKQTDSVKVKLDLNESSKDSKESKKDSKESSKDSKQSGKDSIESEKDLHQFKKNANVPKDDSTKTPKVYYHAKPSDSTLNINSSSLTKPKHSKVRSVSKKYRNGQNVEIEQVNKKSKHDSNIETKQDRNKSSSDNEYQPSKSSRRKRDKGDSKPSKIKSLNPLLDLSSHSVKKESPQDFEVRSKPHPSQSTSNTDNKSSSTLVHSSYPLPTPNSETEMNDFQNEISQVIAFLQKLVTYGPLVNPGAYTRAPKCSESTEVKSKCNSRTKNDLESEYESQSANLQHSESRSDVSIRLESKPIDSHVNNVHNQMTSKENQQKIELEALSSLSNSSIAIDPEEIKTEDAYIQPIKSTSNSSNSNSEVEPKLDQTIEEINDTTENEETKQPEIEVVNNSITIHNNQSEPEIQSNHTDHSESNNQDSSPIVDSNQYINSMHEVNSSLNSLQTPEFETIFVPNPALNQSEGLDSEIQTEMVAIVVPYQSKENLSNDSSTSEGSTLNSVPSENLQPSRVEDEFESTIEADTELVKPSEDPQNSADNIESEGSINESTTEAATTLVTLEPTINKETVGSSIQEKIVPSTQSPAPALTPDNPWLKHIFGKFSHLVNW